MSHVLRKCPTRVSHQSVPGDCATTVSHRTVPHDCPARASDKRVPQECATTLSHRSIQQFFFTRVSHKDCATGVSPKSVLQAFPTRVSTIVWPVAFEYVCAFGFVAFFILVGNLGRYSNTGPSGDWLGRLQAGQFLNTRSNSSGPTWGVLFGARAPE